MMPEFVVRLSDEMHSALKREVEEPDVDRSMAAQVRVLIARWLNERDTGRHARGKGS